MTSKRELYSTTSPAPFVPYPTESRSEIYRVSVPYGLGSSSLALEIPGIRDVKLGDGTILRLSPVLQSNGTVDEDGNFVHAVDRYDHVTGEKWTEVFKYERR